MGSLGFGELFLIILVAAVIFGPNQLPDLARNLGKAVKDFKAMVNRIDSDIKDEVDSIKKSADLSEMDEVLKEVKDVSGDLSEISQTIHQVKAINPMKHPLKSVNTVSKLAAKPFNQSDEMDEKSLKHDVKEVSVDEWKKCERFWTC